jgi:membrane-bound lytic murein transglycosylase D
MLKARFSKAFYLCNSFLLIATPYSVSHYSPKAVVVSKENSQEAAVIKPLHHSNTDLPFVESDLLSAEPQIKLNSKGAIFVRTYIKNRGDCLYNVKKRSFIPFYIIDSIFRQYNIPVELKYLSVIESELKTSATSHVGARGPWQFMPCTAKIMGLKVNRYLDERTNYYKSTPAAARYLKDLYAKFDDWLLVLAAYNGGPRPVYRAIHKSGSRNFWTLQKYLPSESREHVKKFIATHYYFEGHGSETTLTRKENLEYIRAVNVFELRKSTADILVKQKTAADKIPESSDEKFKRVMQESEESLKKSRKLI